MVRKFEAMSVSRNDDMVVARLWSSVGRSTFPRTTESFRSFGTVTYIGGAPFKRRDELADGPGKAVVRATLSRPGSWAYPDMLEVGQLASFQEDRSMFGISPPFKGAVPYAVYIYIEREIHL